MYADMLLADNRPADALVQYRTALQFSPTRLNALYHAGRAAEAAGKPDEAATYFRQLMKVTAMAHTRSGPRSPMGAIS
jgi:predicted TPR repeat methyltransferase